jgi:hypothetical protein
LVIGSRHTTNNTSATTLNGMMDNVRVYTHALSAEAIAEMAKAPAAFWKMNNGTGATASDSVGLGWKTASTAYNGTLTNFPASPWTTGMFDGALSFGSSGDYNDYVNVPYLDATNKTDTALEYKGVAGLTLAAWAYPVSGETSGYLISKNWSSSNLNYRLELVTVSSVAQVRLSILGNGSTPATLTTNISGGLSTGAWHHIAATVPAGTNPTGTIYIDGVAVASGTLGVTNWTPTTDSNLALTLGGPSSGGVAATSFNGKLDNVRIYDTALSATDIHRLAIDPAPAAVPSAPAEPHWSIAASRAISTGPLDLTRFDVLSALPLLALSPAKTSSAFWDVLGAQASRAEDIPASRVNVEEGKSDISRPMAALLSKRFPWSDSEVFGWQTSSNGRRNAIDPRVVDDLLAASEDDMGSSLEPQFSEFTDLAVTNQKS